MNKFCKNCTHRLIPKILKNKFNNLNYPLFVNDFMDDPKVIGCTVKFIKMKWKEFFVFLLERDLLTDKEKKELEKLGWVKEKII